MNEQLHILRTIQEVKDLQLIIGDKEYIAFDTETTGLDKDCKVIGISIAFDTESAYYIILYEYNVESDQLHPLETTKCIEDFLRSLKERQLIAHNAIYDCRVIYDNFKIRLIDSIHTDTLILGHLLNENRPNGLKELGVGLFGDDAKTEQNEMKASVIKNGGVLNSKQYELYKADPELIAKYGAKDALLTIKIFYVLVPELIEQGLYDFFYKEESMPLLKGPTYDLNTFGLKIDVKRLTELKGSLEAEILEAKAIIHAEITPHIISKYKGDKASNTFNLNSKQQLSWLLFEVLEADFGTLTESGKELCKALDLPLPYALKDKRNFLHEVRSKKGEVYLKAHFDRKLKKQVKDKVIKDAWTYLSFDMSSIIKHAKTYKWVEKYLEYTKNTKTLNTYVDGILEKLHYGVIYPSFLQHGTSSGRYSSRDPNFQNLPRDDKRIKACVTSRQGKVFVGADFSQLEPRVFASFSKDERLLSCFKDNDDFYSVIGAGIFGCEGMPMKKDDPGSFASIYKEERQMAKAVALAAAYGVTAPRISHMIGKSTKEAQEIIDDYFERFPSVHKLMYDTHEKVMKDGQIPSLYGRMRRLPHAKNFKELYGNTPHAQLPYEIRNTLNLSMNHTIQSTGASIVNRASIALRNNIKKYEIEGCYIILQVHDELIVECNEQDADLVSLLLKDAMQFTVSLPGVDLIAEPKIGRNLAELK